MQLEQVLVALRAHVAPRAGSAKELAALAAVAPSPELAALYGWGANLDTFETTGEGPEWLSLRDARSELAALRQLADFPRRLFPIAGDGAGNFSCLDLESGKVVDWDHETRKSRGLAPTLAAYIERQLLRGAARTAKLAAREAKEKATQRGPLALADVPEMPAKLTRIPRTDLAKLDSAGYSGGVACAVLLTGSRLFLGMNNSSSIVDLNKRTVADAAGDGAMHAAYSPATERLVTLGSTYNVYDAKRGTLLAQWSGYVGEISTGYDLALTPDGQLAASGSQEGVIFLWDVGKRTGLPKQIAKSRFSRDVPPGKPLRTLRGGKQFIQWLSFSPDGALLASGDYANVVRIFDIRTGRVLRTMKGAGGDGGAFGPDGTLATARDGVVTLWDARGRALRTLKRAGIPLFVTDRVLATADKDLTLWHVPTGKRLATTKMLKNRQRSLSLSCLGASLVTTGPLGLFQIS